MTINEFISTNIIGGGACILTIIYMIMILSSYHNKYFVWYSNFSRGIKYELISAAIIAVIMSALTFIFWPLIVGILGLIVFLNIRKTRSLFVRLIWIIPASVIGLFVTVVGICLWATS